MKEKYVDYMTYKVERDYKIDSREFQERTGIYSKLAEV